MEWMPKTPKNFSKETILREIISQTESPTSDQTGYVLQCHFRTCGLQNFNDISQTESAISDRSLYFIEMYYDVWQNSDPRQEALSIIKIQSYMKQETENHMIRVRSQTGGQSYDKSSISDRSIIKLKSKCNIRNN